MGLDSLLLTGNWEKNIVAEAEVAEAEAGWDWDGETPFLDIEISIGVITLTEKTKGCKNSTSLTYINVAELFRR